MFEVTGWLEAGEARCKPVSVDRQVMRHFHRYPLVCRVPRARMFAKHLLRFHQSDDVTNATRVHFLFFREKLPFSHAFRSFKEAWNIRLHNMTQRLECQASFHLWVSPSQVWLEHAITSKAQDWLRRRQSALGRILLQPTPACLHVLNVEDP